MKMLRLALVPIVILLCVQPAPGRYHSTGVAPDGPRLHVLTAEPAATTSATLPSTTAHVAHLGVAPRLAWQSRHDQLDSALEGPFHAAVRGSSPSVGAEAYISAHRVAATGSVSFRATSLPPPSL